MGQRLDTRSYPMRGSPLLARRDFRMLPAHLPATSRALANLHRVTPHFRLRLRRNVRGGDNLLPCFSQRPATARTTLYTDGHIDRLNAGARRRRVPEPEEPLAGLAPRRLRVRLMRAFGKWRRPTSALQLLDLRPLLLDHSLQIENDLNQFLAAKRFQAFQDPGCTILPAKSRIFKSGDKLSSSGSLINYLLSSVLRLFLLVGGIMIALGVTGLLDSFVRFALQGVGTPAPVFPTRHLVVTGLYRHVRNPT